MIPRGIVLHLSASRFGDAAQINDWHLQRGWSGIGYHSVILNGVRRSGNAYDPSIDGLVEPGRPENLMGAHCKANGMNRCTLGIVSIGNPGVPITGAVPAPPGVAINPYLTQQQFQSLLMETVRLCLKYNLNPAGSFVHPVSGRTFPVISQHSMHEPGKPLCASLNINTVRQAIIEEFNLARNSVQARGFLRSVDPGNLVGDPAFLERNLAEFRMDPDGPQDLTRDAVV